MKHTPKTQIGTLREQMLEVVARVARVEERTDLLIWLVVALMLSLSGLVAYILWGQ